MAQESTVTQRQKDFNFSGFVDKNLIKRFSEVTTGDAACMTIVAPAATDTKTLNYERTTEEKAAGK